jgi:hypothetical protein
MMLGINPNKLYVMRRFQTMSYATKGRSDEKRNPSIRYTRLAMGTSRHTQAASMQYHSLTHFVLLW